jgi:hypothetical protein
MGRQVVRLKDVNVDSCAVGIEDQRRIPEAGAPTGIDESSPDVALQPPTVEPIELVMIRLAGCKGSVRSEAVDGIQGHRGVWLFVHVHPYYLFLSSRDDRRSSRDTSTGRRSEDGQEIIGISFWDSKESELRIPGRQKQRRLPIECAVTAVPEHLPWAVSAHSTRRG